MTPFWQGSIGDPTCLDEILGSARTTVHLTFVPGPGNLREQLYEHEPRRTLLLREWLPPGHNMLTLNHTIAAGGNGQRPLWSRMPVRAAPPGYRSVQGINAEPESAPRAGGLYLRQQDKS